MLDAILKIEPGIADGLTKPFVIIVAAEIKDGALVGFKAVSGDIHPYHLLPGGDEAGTAEKAVLVNNDLFSLYPKKE